MKTEGIHLLCELSGCNSAALANSNAVKHAVQSAAAAMELAPIREHYDELPDGGVTGLVAMERSHLSIRTFPKRAYAAVDICVFGDDSPHKAAATIAAALEARHFQIREISRGLESKIGFESKDTSGSTKRSGKFTHAQAGDERFSDKRECFWYIEDADPHERHLYEVDQWLVQKKTKFQQVGIILNRSYGKILFLDGAVQSSQRDEYVYHEALIHPSMIAHPDPQRVLVLGGGEGATLREVMKYPGVKHATMVDIDGELVEECRKHLPEWSNGAFEDKRSRLVIADGKEWIEKSKEKFDVIIMDLTDQIDLGPSFQLYTQNFYKAVRDRLNSNGIFLVQAGELSACEYYSHASIRKTLATVFPRAVTYAQHVPTFFAQWSFVAATLGDIDMNLPADAVDKRIVERVKGELKFYDGRTHHRMFALPKDINRSLDTSGTVVTSEEDFEKKYEASLVVYRA